MEKRKTAALVCCSNPLPMDSREKIGRLNDVLGQIGVNVMQGNDLYETKVPFSMPDRKRAENLMRFYREGSVDAVFDVSGGDMANGLLPYLDFGLIAETKAEFWGYSDLTTILNAIYTKTGKSSVLYQVRNLVYRDGRQQVCDFTNSFLYGKNDLFSFRYHFVQGEQMEGIVVGGNIRCLLKLAGTEYWPDMHGKILLLESFGGQVPQMLTYLSQLQQMHVFCQVNGILLGTFTKMEEGGCLPAIGELVKRYAGSGVPIAKTDQIGHGTNAKAIRIGKHIIL